MTATDEPLVADSKSDRLGLIVLIVLSIATIAAVGASLVIGPGPFMHLSGLFLSVCWAGFSLAYLTP